MFVLRVLDAEDQTIGSPGVLGYREAPTYQFLYAPGEAHTMKFKDPFTNLVTEWAPIKYWGYDLGVGTYQLSATAGRESGDSRRMAVHCSGFRSLVRIARTL